MGELKILLDGYSGFRLTHQIPGYSYYRHKRIQIMSTVSHRGPPALFLTFSAHRPLWEDLSGYLNQMWKFRDIPESEYSNIQVSLQMCYQNLTNTDSINNFYIYYYLQDLIYWIHQQSLFDTLLRESQRTS